MTCGCAPRRIRKKSMMERIDDDCVSEGPPSIDCALMLDAYEAEIFETEYDADAEVDWNE